jgi:hypothetical protein
MSIAPDTKDWTWVLARSCPECGYDAATVARSSLGARTRDALPHWQQALARPDAAVRPRPQVWSPLEYACHVRDVFRIFDERLRLMLDQDDPLFANWDQDAAATAGRYAEQDSRLVADEVQAAGETIAVRFDAVPPDAWTRPGRRSNGSIFTVESLGRYFLHDIEHHLHDVRADSPPPA